jgi:TonB family protein
MTICIQAQTLKLPTKKTKGTTEKQEKTQEEPQANQSGTLILPTTTANKDKSEATPEAPAQNATTPSAVVGENGVLQLPVVKRQTAPRAKPIVKKPKPEDNEIYESAEHMPTYPGGVAELMKFIGEKMQYPQEALADSAQGIVQVSFIVEKDGTPKEFEVLDEHHPALEAEAVRVLQQMPKWKPATQNGVKVRVEYVVPVKFSLPNQL